MMKDELSNDPMVDLLLQDRYLLKKFVGESNFGMFYEAIDMKYSDASSAKTDKILVKIQKDLKLSQKEYTVLSLLN